MAKASNWVDLFPEPVWTDSQELERCFLMYAPHEALGALMMQEEGDAEPLVVLCSLFEPAEGAFTSGADLRRFGLTISQLRDLADTLERKWASDGGN